MPRSETSATVRVTVHLTPDDRAAALRHDALAGLTAPHKHLSPKWLYDQRGNELFDEITRLPEYYLTRTERAILVASAPAVADTTGVDTLVEIGSGNSEKTRVLLQALDRRSTLRRYVPFDVAEDTLWAAARTIASDHPGLEVDGVVGDFEHHLGLLPMEGRRLIAFLGSTIGNLGAPARIALLAQLAASMGPEDGLLLATDMVKDRDRLVAAYDDAAGVTAAFDKNVLAVLNRELAARFDLDSFAHVARFDDEHERIEMRLRSLHAQVVPVPGLGVDVAFEEGEDILTEISAKFRPETVRSELEAAGLTAARSWTDPDGDYTLWLARR